MEGVMDAWVSEKTPPAYKSMTNIYIDLNLYGSTASHRKENYEKLAEDLNLRFILKKTLYIVT